jgi:RES domain-containing protein
MIELITTLERELCDRTVPDTVEGLSERLEPLSIGLTQTIPVLFADTRMFRIRRMDRKPDSIDQVGAPPHGKSPIGRLNDEGQSVLYLADTPVTAFAEARGPVAGEFCLSEWRVTAQKLGMANGGFSPTMLSERCPIKIGDASLPVQRLREEDERILGLYREIFTLDVGTVPALYRWSIACGMANGFSHRCGRTSVETTPDGNTQFNGRHPFAGVAYPSMRTGRAFWNYALNDCGQSQIKLDHVQWVRRAPDGKYASLDYANAWDEGGRIIWQNRPARFDLRPGEQCRLTKTGPTEWLYETGDGSVPRFS